MVSLIADNGVIISRRNDASIRELEAADFKVIDVGKQVLMAVRSSQTASLQGRKLVIVVCYNFPHGYARTEST